MESPNAAYAWVTTPDGERKRKWVYGKIHDEVHAKWIKLQSTAAEGPVPTSKAAALGAVSWAKGACVVDVALLRDELM